MKISEKYFLLTIMAFGFGYSQSESLNETLEDMAKKNAQSYLAPMVTAFGTSINSGTFHNAKPHKLLGFDFKLGVSMTSVTEALKTFEYALPDIDVDVDISNISIPGISTISVNPNAIYESNRTSQTMFGEATSNSIEVDQDKLKDAIVTEVASSQSLTEQAVLGLYSNEIDAAVNNTINNIEPINTPEGLNLPVAPMVMPQISIGLPKDIELTFRGMPPTEYSEMGKLKFLGYGGKIGLNQFIPLPNIALPYISVGYYMTNFEVGNIMKMKNSIATLQVSKSLPILTFYGGFGLESSSLDVDYIYTDTKGDNDPSNDVGNPINFNLNGDNKFRTTMGVRLKLAIISINVDYNIGKLNTLNIGAGLTIR